MNRYRQRDAGPISSLPKDNYMHVIKTHVVWLVIVYFSLSILFFTLAVIADTPHPDTITIYLWGRVITELILGTAYFLFVHLWQRGKFWGYLRMLMTSVLALVSALSVVVLEGTYPWWLRAEQTIQVIVVLLLLYILTRPDMRTRFRKKLPAGKTN